MNEEKDTASVKVFAAEWRQNSSLDHVRTSNLELFRVLVMFLIVAHHYVVNSGLTAADGPIYVNPISWRSLFLLLFGAWGKTGINCFIMITGYFMCKSEITMKKFAKLLSEIMFYRIVIYLVFLFTGYESFSLKLLVKALLPIGGIEQNFIDCFPVFYLCIPFLNILIQNLSEQQHMRLLALSVFIYVFFGTVPFLSVSMNYVSWFIVVYFIASYLRLYPKKLFDSSKFWGGITLLCVTVSAMSVIACAWLGTVVGHNMAYFFVSDSNTFLAVATGVSSFLLFKNLKIRQSGFINTVAASTFGVLLIHANSDTMRRWLWKDVLKNVEVYDSEWLILHALISVLCVFIICTVVDIIRKRLFEKIGVVSVVSTILSALVCKLWRE